MRGNVTASTVVTLSRAAAGPAAGRIKLTVQPGVSPYGTVYLRLYPGRGAIRATAGTVQTLGLRTHKNIVQAVEFNGSDRASLDYPISGGFTLIDRTPSCDADGNGISAQLSVDRGDIVASKPFYGMAVVQYDTTYALIQYRHSNPPKDAIVYAFLDGAVASQKIQAPTIAEGSMGLAELYRIVSDVIVDPDGRWELPPGWPDNSTYPGNIPGPDPDNHTRTERIHEMGFIRADGYLERVPYNAPIEQPYKGSYNYRPAVRLEMGAAPAGYEAAFQGADWDAIRARLALYG